MCQINLKLLLWLKAIMNCGIFNIMFCYCMVHTLTGTFSVLSHVLFLTLSHQGSEVLAPCETENGRSLLCIHSSERLQV